jgi:subtilase family serine protease
LKVAPYLVLLAAFVLAGCGKKSAMEIVSSQPGQPGENAAAIAANAMPSRFDRNVAIPWSSVPRAGEMHTNHLIYVGAGQGMAAAASVYYTPAQIRQAYGVPAGGSGTIVIVDAFDDPYALADFNTFSAQYGLPQETSTNVTASTNQHLQVVYASGRKPRTNAGWSQEANLDIQWAHAMAPNAKIVLVEAASNSGSNLYAADDVAATIAGTRQCSNSWGGGESSGEAGSDSHFNHAGVVYLFSSGDTGGAKDYPAASPNVVAVGGTSLFLDASGNRTSETVWNGTGCGPSAYEPRPSFQNGVATVVGTKRGIADVAAVADPNTGVIVRWNGGWYVFGGTSVACPVVAGMINTAGTNRGSGPAQNTALYAGLGGPNFFDVTSGAAGAYSALSGYDFPTGVGAPKGLGGF